MATYGYTGVPTDAQRSSPKGSQRQSKCGPFRSHELDTEAHKAALVRVSSRYINYAMYRIRMLQHHGVIPYVVFDGDRLPSKSGTEEDREARRTSSRQAAEELARAGKHAAAFEHYAKCVDVTPTMAFQLIKALKRAGVEYVVAPYEADAQLAWLERNHIIDAIVTEDSDLLVFGCKRVLFKMDSDGNCIEVAQTRITSCKALSFAGWTTDLFRQMAILSGCDYLPSIPGMGLKNAHRLLQRHKSVKKVLQAVRLEGKMRVPADYSKDFERAERTFLHQRVWDTQRQCLTMLQPVTDEADATIGDFIGPDVAHDLAIGIVTGRIDPITKLLIEDTGPTSPSFRRGRENRPASKSLPTSSVRPSKGQAMLGQFFTKAQQGPSSSALRTPLAPRDLNKSVSHDSAGLSVTLTKESRFFGGSNDQTARSASQSRVTQLPQTMMSETDNVEHLEVTADASALTQALEPPNSQSPMSGFGDFFCELDGADPAILIDDEAEQHRSSPLPGGMSAVHGVAAQFSPEGNKSEKQRRRKSESVSDLSENDKTPEKKHARMDSGLSSPLAFEEKANDTLVRGTSAGQAHRSNPDQAESKIISTPDDPGASDDMQADGYERRPSPASPSDVRVKMNSLKRKHSEETGDDTQEGLGVDLQQHFTPKAGADLWQRFAHAGAENTAEAPFKTPLNTGTRPKLRHAATTSGASSGKASHRPLRLYRGEEGAQVNKQTFEVVTPVPTGCTGGRSLSTPRGGMPRRTTLALDGRGDEMCSTPTSVTRLRPGLSTPGVASDGRKSSENKVPASSRRRVAAGPRRSLSMVTAAAEKAGYQDEIEDSPTSSTLGRKGSSAALLPMGRASSVASTPVRNVLQISSRQNVGGVEGDDGIGRESTSKKLDTFRYRSSS